MDQYLKLCNRIINEGTLIENKRTNKHCLTVIDANLTFNAEDNKFPIVTTRKSYFKQAISELLGYIRGFTSAAEFRSLGCKTWDANANENEAWLKNPNRKGHDDCGLIYGAISRNYPKPDGGSIDLLRKVVDNLTKGIDDRAEIVTHYHPGMFELGCLRPCLHTYHFSLLKDDLYLSCYQRSADVPLGLNFNQIQVFTMLRLIAQITNKNPKQAFLKITNAHIYSDQIDLMKDVQLKREPFDSPKLIINPDIKTLEDLETWVTADDFEVEDYKHHEAINYPFSV